MTSAHLKMISPLSILVSTIILLPTNKKGAQFNPQCLSGVPLVVLWLYKSNLVRACKSCKGELKKRPFSLVSDEGKFRILSKFVSEKDARGAISNDITLDEALVEVLPTEWKLEDDELPLVPHVKKYFSESAWLIVEDGLKRLKQQANTGKQKFM